MNLRQDCGRPEISAVDVITALGWAMSTAKREALVPGFDALATRLIRFKWARQFDVLPALHAEVVRFAMWQFGRKHWAVYERKTVTAIDTMRLFAAQVLVEFDDGVCHGCHGRGQALNNRGLMVVCPTCNGAAREVVSDRARARALWMDKNSVRDTWGERLDFVQSELVEIDRQAVCKVRSFLQEL